MADPEGNEFCILHRHDAGLECLFTNIRIFRSRSLGGA